MKDYPLMCPYCGGNGFTLGYENVHIECKHCKGTGEEQDACDYCGGSGYDPHPNHDTTMRPCPKCSDSK